MTATAVGTSRPRLRAGDWVEVKSADEILATLDGQACVDALPFMPEMLQYCGRRFRVFKSAHKACDTIETHASRRMTDAVHLEDLRCDGAAHGGCQAGCLLYWKTAWLKPVRGPASATESVETRAATRPASERVASTCDRDALARATEAPPAARETEKRYRCQATEMSRATTPLAWWDPRYYARDLLSRNVRLSDFLRSVMIAAFNIVMRLHWRLRPYPYVSGLATPPTPTAVLNLQAGEHVEVRTQQEIMRTLNLDGNRNRGLSFDVEMVPYCGKRFRVLRRVERLIDEKSGRMIPISSDCIILDGVTCSGLLSRDRLFCPRSIYGYWREIWLRRVGEAESKPGVATPDLT